MIKPAPGPSLYRFFSSLKLTVALLTLAMVLVFAGTLAQVQLGLYQAQKQVFETFVVWRTWGNLRLPVFPGGYTITLTLLVNLSCAGLRYFRLGLAKTGITLIHGGLVLLIAGGLLTAWLARESQMSLFEGQTRNFSEDFRLMELVFVNETDAATDQVVSIHQHYLAHQDTIATPELPFTVKVRAYYPNSTLRVGKPHDRYGPPVTRGPGRNIFYEPLPVETRDDHRNAVLAVIEILQNGTSQGTWLVSNAMDGYQVLEAGATTWYFRIRSVRYYYPFSIQLLDFTHDRYPGTNIPKNFSSLIQLTDPSKQVERDVLIYMNHPLRYEGHTFYQASFGENDTLSVLQVVKNPAWQLPYIACTLIALGMLFHFGRMLWRFLGRSRS